MHTPPPRLLSGTNLVSGSIDVSAKVGQLRSGPKSEQTGRERKRNQLTSLEQRVQSLERQNSELTTKLAARNEELGQVRGELASLNRGASGEGQAVRASESAALEGAPPPSLRSSSSHAWCPSQSPPWSLLWRDRQFDASNLVGENGVLLVPVEKWMCGSRNNACRSDRSEGVLLI